MKTAVSIPDDVFEQAELLAEQLETSRSELYARALREYVFRHSPERVTEALDRALAELPAEADPFAEVAARRVLEQVEW